MYSDSSWSRTSRLRRSGVDHTVLPANTPHLPLPRSSPEGATTEWTVIAPDDEAYYSLIDPCEDERLSWPCWLTYSGRFTHIYGYPSAAGQHWGWALDRVHNSRRPLDRLQYVFALCNSVTSTFLPNTTWTPTRRTIPVASLVNVVSAVLGFWPSQATP